MGTKRRAAFPWSSSIGRCAQPRHDGTFGSGRASSLGIGGGVGCHSAGRIRLHDRRRAGAGGVAVRTYGGVGYGALRLRERDRCCGQADSGNQTISKLEAANGGSTLTDTELPNPALKRKFSLETQQYHLIEKQCAVQYGTRGEIFLRAEQLSALKPRMHSHPLSRP